MAVVLLQQPDFGKRGAATAMKARFTYLDDGEAFTFPTIPAGSVISSIMRNVVETFDSGSSDEVTVGESGGDTDELVAAADSDLTTLGMNADTSNAADGVPFQVASDYTPVMTYASGGTAPSQGICDVTILVLNLNDA